MKFINKLVSGQIFCFSLFGQNPKAPSNKLHSEIKSRANQEYAALEQLYQHLHANPELSFHEEKTAARLAEELRKAGFTVTRNLGGHDFVFVENGLQSRVIMARLTRRDQQDRSFDHEFWEKVGAAGRFAAAWQMIREV